MIRCKFCDFILDLNDCQYNSEYMCPKCAKIYWKKKIDAQDRMDELTKPIIFDYKRINHEMF